MLNKNLDLFQRDQEKHLLGKIYDDCRSGLGRIVLISGPAASGKTALLDHLRQRVVQEGGTHLGAIGSKGETELPFSLLNQLVAAVGLEPLKADHTSCGPLSPHVASRLDELCLEIRLTAAESPLLLHFDDAHLADEASSRGLLYLLRRLHQAPVMTVVLERAPDSQSSEGGLCELSRLPRFDRIRLGPLDTAGVLHMVATLRPEITEPDVSRLMDLTAGIPGLVRAVLQEGPGHGGEDGDFLPGPSYRTALAEYMRRQESSVLEVAKALSVAEEAGSEGDAMSVLSSVRRETSAAMARLAATGLIDDRGFRHPEARSAVSDLMTPRERDAAHLHRARLLHADGAPMKVIARHLCLAGVEQEPWAVPLLCEAAEQAVEHGELEFAVDCLSSATSASKDERERSEIALSLAATLWRDDPGTAVPHLLRIGHGPEVGRLSPCALYSLVRGLLWAGFTDQVRSVLTRRSDRSTDGPPDRGEAIEVAVTASLCSTTYPDVTSVSSAPTVSSTSCEPSLLSTQALRLRGVESLHDALCSQDRERAITKAEEVLTNSGLGEHMIEAVFAAVSTLIYTDELDRAGYWSRMLLAAPSPSPLWLAQADALNAEVSLRTGALVHAREYATSALGRLSRPGWGVVVGWPSSVLLRVAVAMGDRAEASRIVAEPVNVEMLRSRYGLHFLYARGLHHLEAGRPQSALADLSACGRLMREWDLDRPELVPWRGSAARAHLLLGDTEEALRLVREQETKAHPDHPRTRGVLLRDTAVALPPRTRVPLLERAVFLLKRMGDDLESARAELDLETAHLALGDTARARPHGDRGRAGLAALGVPVEFVGYSVGPPARARSGPSRERSSTDVPVPGLSKAEARVAFLAAEGMTNKQISARLHVTVSTVEQHLTRIYRRHGISDRRGIGQVLSRG